MTVGVVAADDGAGERAGERAVAAVEDAGEAVHAGDARSVADADPEYVVAVGESALLSVARERPTAPVLPVAVGRGFQSVPEDALASGVASLFEGHTPSERRLLSVEVGGETVGPAVLDVALFATEPGRISEYSVSTGSTTVARFRADGVVAATPAGSQGYARCADGPVAAPSIDAAVVVPVAPFAIDLDQWVLDLADPLRLAVEREEASVTLQVDGREVREVGRDDPVEIGDGGSFTIAVVPESQGFFGESQ